MKSSRHLSMLGKLRAKFIALNMATVTVVLLVVLGGILIASHQQEQAEIDEALTEAIDPYVTAELVSSDGLTSTKALDYLSKQMDKDSSSTSRIGNNHKFDPTPIATYRVQQNEYTYLPKSSSARLSDSVVEEALTQVANDTPSSQDSSPCFTQAEIPALGLYYHAACVNDTLYVAFADSSSIQNWQSQALILALGGLGALVLFFIVSLAFSRWALRPVEESWQAQKSFVADASHELKTPLTVILANNSILQKHDSDTVSSQRQWLESTEHEAKRMQGLVDDMLTLARLDEGVMPAQEKESVDLSSLVEGSILQFESLAWEKNITLSDNVEDGIGVRGFSNQLSRLVDTLLENALKYAGADHDVDISLKKNGSNAILTVSNSGTAIPAEDLPHIFDRFYRADKARTHSDAAGHGLGLSIAAKITETHGGSITAASGNGRTSFVVKLPLGN